MHGFALTVEQPVPEVFTFGLAGELDMTKAYTLDEELRAAERRRPEVIVVDLRELRFMDSSGLARIVAAHRRAARGRHRFCVVRGGRTIQRILAMAALDRALDLIDDPAEAIPATA